MNCISYRYRNPGLSGMDLWVARPVEGLTQDQVCLDRESLQPVQIEDVGSGLVTRYHLSAGQTLALDWTFQPLAAPLERGQRAAPSLSEGDRVRYLRVSAQLSREPEIVARAQALAAGCTGPVEIAHAFFQTLVTEYSYRYPVWHRGALAMSRLRQGDCGQFTALFCAWCRAAGIPARPVVGTLLAPGRMLPHAWAEFWTDEGGWVPVDPSLAQARPEPDAFFGRLPADRFAFSYDMDVPLAAYGRPVRPAPFGVCLTRLRFGQRRLSWGAATLNGHVPYFQPAYPRIYSGWGPNFLIAPDQLGVWRDGAPPPAQPGYPRLGAMTVVAAIVGSLFHEPVAALCFLALGFLLSAITWRQRRMLVT
ncbi:MAG: transglutaminase-like domain-containing protein [Chloroflexota bacterium]|nr:transglutaminase-like domain-containing protein [Chloroflexota bacterium]